MTKLPKLNSQVKFCGNVNAGESMPKTFTGTVVGYGHVMGDIWHDEPEQVALVALDAPLNGMLAVGPNGLEYVDKNFDLQNRMPKTAKLVQDNLPGFNGHAALYLCDPPMVSYDGKEHEFVVVSAVNEPTIVGRLHETYIFPADAKGRVVDWAEMKGSTKDTESHELALNNAGYTLV